MGSPDEHWFDAIRAVRVEPLGPSSPKDVPFKHGPGSAEAILSALLLTWPETACPLVLGDAPCRWVAISATGRGDLRGFATPRDAPHYPVCGEVKVKGEGQEGLPKGKFEEALQQAVTGLTGIVEKRKYLPEAAWLGAKPSASRGAIVLAADGWRLKPEFVDEILHAAARKASFLGRGSELRATVISVTRHLVDGQRRVRVERLYDRWLPAGR